MEEFKYNNYGQQQTGFSNSIDHQWYGHWSNPEYQENCQLAEMTEEEFEEYKNKKAKESEREIGELPF